MRVGIFPGSFNPFHLGHLSVVQLALKHDFDLIYIVISQNPSKTLNNFKLNLEQIKIIINEHQLNDKVKVLIEAENIPQLARTLKINQIIRGFRDQKDLEYEEKLKQLYLIHNPNLKFKIYKAESKYRKIRGIKL